MKAIMIKLISYLFSKLSLKFRETLVIQLYSEIPLTQVKIDSINQNFRTLQLDYLNLETKVIKYQKKNKGGCMTGKFLRIINYERDYIISELINCKNFETFQHLSRPIRVN